MSYRPITDVWILARPKLKADENGNKQSYYGAFPAGFLHRARQLLGVRRTDPVLHVCGGMTRENRYRGFEDNDRTLDLNPDLRPDYLMDARRLGVNKGDLFPLRGPGVVEVTDDLQPEQRNLWPAILIDRPYTQEDHEHYDVPSDVFPADLNDLLRRALECVEPGGRVGVIDYLWPSPPGKLGKEVAVIAVGTGRNNRARWFTVFERLIEKDQDAPTGRGSDVAAEEPIRGPGSTAIAPAAESLPVEAPSKRRRKVASAEPVECVACGGTRKNSKGGDCVPCQNRAALVPAVRRVLNAKRRRRVPSEPGEGAFDV